MGKPAEHRITAEKAAAYRARWKVVSGSLRTELRAMPIETKLKQLDALVRLAKQLNWTSVEDGADVRERWAHIRSCGSQPL
jgi:hypothetical protein